MPMRAGPARPGSAATGGDESPVKTADDGDVAGMALALRVPLKQVT
jgi:hypothetical protein